MNTLYLFIVFGNVRWNVWFWDDQVEDLEAAIAEAVNAEDEVPLHVIHDLKELSRNVNKHCLIRIFLGGDNILQEVLNEF